MSPVYIVSIFTGITILDGQNFITAKEKIYNEFWPTYVVDMSIWPTVQFFNFRYVPLRHQVLVVNIVGIFYSAFISYMQRIA